MAVTERACRVTDEATDTVSAVQSFLSGVAARTGAIAAINTAGDCADSPALTESLGTGSLFPISHLHVVFGVEVVIATKPLHCTHVSTGNSHKCYAAPVIVHLQSEVCLKDCKPAACVKLEFVVFQCHREVGELTIDLQKKIIKQNKIYVV